MTNKKKEKGTKARKLQLTKVTIKDLSEKGSGKVKGGRGCDCTVTYK